MWIKGEGEGCGLLDEQLARAEQRLVCDFL
jgi:hypothetical protein